MGTLRFGKEEKIHCIVDLDLKGASGEPTCLAYKTTTYWVGAGAYFKDEGYVVGQRSQQGWYPLETAEGHLPHPLPPYSISSWDYVWGYSLWIAIAITVAWYVGVSRLKKARQSKFEERVANAPIDYGPPRWDTEGDRFIREQISARLAPGDSIVHQAYAVAYDYGEEKAGTDPFFLVLTRQALYLMKTRPGAFGILFENGGIDVVPHSAIAEASVGEGIVFFVTTTDGTQRGYVIKPTKKLSNQEAFLMNAARILGEGFTGKR